MGSKDEAFVSNIDEFYLRAGGHAAANNVVAFPMSQFSSESNAAHMKVLLQFADENAGAGLEESRTATKKLDSGVSMAAPTREEIDAKLEAVEARTETRFVELGGKMDRLSDAIASLTTAVTSVKNEVAGVRSEVKEENKFTRWTVGVTLVASLIAFAGALWTTQGNLLSAFQASLAVHSVSQPAPMEPPNRQK